MELLYCRRTLATYNFIHLMQSQRLGQCRRCHVLVHRLTINHYQRLQFNLKGVLSAPRISTWFRSTHTLSKYWTKLAVINKTAFRGFFWQSFQATVWARLFQQLPFIRFKHWHCSTHTPLSSTFQGGSWYWTSIYVCKTFQARSYNEFINSGQTSSWLFSFKQFKCIHQIH